MKLWYDKKKNEGYRICPLVSCFVGEKFFVIVYVVYITSNNIYCCRSGRSGK